MSDRVPVSPPARDPPPARDLLRVRGLHTRFLTGRGVVRAVNGVGFSVRRGETLALVGESGSGKTAAMLSVLRLLPPHRTRIRASEVRFRGQDLLRLDDEGMRRVRGAEIAMVFQDPRASLNPVLTIGRQLTEGLEAHRGVGRREARDRAIELLRSVGIPGPDSRLGDYPHQFSGGMCQRVAIAMALSCEPSLLIADEPTTALDATIQAQILDLVSELRATREMAMIWISHDLGVVSRLADRIAVMYGGSIVETASAERLFASPAHPYTRGLLASLPAPGEESSQGRLNAGRLNAIPGRPPDMARLPDGCAFAERCPHAFDRCRREKPPLLPVGKGARAACWWDVDQSRERAVGRDAKTDGSSRPRSSCPRSRAPKPRIRSGSVAAGRPAPRDPVRGGDLPPGHGGGPIPGDARPLLEVTGLRKHFPVRRGAMWRRAGSVKAVDGVSFRLRRGETLGLVGESGCGKTSAARAVLGLTEPTAGRIIFDGVDFGAAPANEVRALRPRMQMIFQDSYSSLNPRMSVGRSIAEPLLEHTTMGRAERRSHVAELMGVVGLDPKLGERLPHELSGGQRQRAGIARALALRPDLIICDEPISSLDISIQARIVNLLSDVQRQFGLTYLFISHDLRMVRHLCGRVAVMYLGKIIEEAPAEALFRDPKHPYTQALLSAIPRWPGRADDGSGSPHAGSRQRGGQRRAARRMVDAEGPGGRGRVHEMMGPVDDETGPPAGDEKERIVLSGEAPSPAEPPPGCRFHTRCAHVEARCREEAPELRAVGGERRVACHLVR